MFFNKKNSKKKNLRRKSPKKVKTTNDFQVLFYKNVSVK